MGRGYSSCSKEALHRCSLPLGKSLHMREHTVPSALIQIHEHLRVNISTHGGVDTAVRQHASTGRDAPTHTHRHVHRYSRVHRHAHTHLVQAHQNTQRLAPRATQVCTRGAQAGRGSLSYISTPRAPMCTHTLSSLWAFRPLVALLMMTLWRSQPSG